MFHYSTVNFKNYTILTAARFGHVTVFVFLLSSSHRRPRVAETSH